MEFQISHESISKSKPITFDNVETSIQICGYCGCYWHEGEMQKHTPKCDRPYLGP